MFWPGEFHGLYVCGVTKSQTQPSHFLLIISAYSVKSVLHSDPLGWDLLSPSCSRSPSRPPHGLQSACLPGLRDGVLLCEDRTASGGQEQDLRLFKVRSLAVTKAPLQSRETVCVRDSRGIWENSAPSAQLHCGPKTCLKHGL